jgi:acetyltransferase-like isoleucine patch superfamily enzyme
MSEERSSVLLPIKVAFRVVHLLVNAVMVWRFRWRRAVLLVRLRVAATFHRSDLRIQVASDLRLGRGVRVLTYLGKSAELEIAERCRIGDGVRIELRGGSMIVGPGTDIRERCLFGLAGRLRMEREIVFQHGITVHCDEAITLGEFVGIAEYSTIVDSSHRQGDESEWFGDIVVTAPIELGRNVFLASKVTVTKGVHIGERAVIGANSVVVKDLPAGHWASGVPAKDMGPVPALEGQGTTEPPSQPGGSGRVEEIVKRSS